MWGASQRTGSEHPPVPPEEALGFWETYGWADYSSLLFPHIGCNRPEKLIPHDIQILKDDAETSESLDDHSHHWVTSCLSLPENLLRARIHGTWHYHGDCSNKTHVALSSWGLPRQWGRHVNKLVTK